MSPAPDQTNGSTHVVVDIADMKATNNPRGQISTYALGSCVAVAIYDPEAHIGALLHYILPESVIQREKAMVNPFLFADTGIPLLFRRAYKLGASKERIVCRLAGASNVLDPNNFFNVGMRNHVAAKKILSKNNVEIYSEFVGGLKGVTLTMHMNNGRVIVKTPRGEDIEL